MDFFTKYRRQINLRLFLVFFLIGVLTFGLGLALNYLVEPPVYVIVVASAACYTVLALFGGAFLLRDTTEPTKKIWDVIQFISPHSDQHVSPDLAQLKIGREMVTRLAEHIYQLARVVSDAEKDSAVSSQDIHGNFVANSLPLPLIVLNSQDEIVFANEAASEYLGKPAAELAGQSVGTVFDMSFASADTFQKWQKQVRSKNVTAKHQWERVRLGLPGQSGSKQFDLAAHYNRSNPLGYETLLVLFDHTEIYSQDDQAMGFVAVAVHELRTPLTLMRGYVEVFEDEIGPSLSPEHKEFMSKMSASAQQLTSFVNNILNVAKIEDNQLTLKLREESWPDVINNVVSDISLRAQVRGVTIKTDIADNLPTVGVDRYSIYEVVANLLDNAIKYCGDNKTVELSTKLDGNGLVETSISDNGVGIDSSILPHIFDKFYRNHRNRSQVGGTGLGLFLSRAIVQAHGGQIGVSSKIGKGSTFTFTVQPYSHLSDSAKAGDKGGIVRGAHGWIKNHSLYRE